MSAIPLKADIDRACPHVRFVPKADIRLLRPISDELIYVNAAEGVSRGPSLRKKLIGAARRLSKSALSLQVRAGRRDPIALGIENRDPITVVALVVKWKLVSVEAMCSGCHRDAHEKTPRPLPP
jgi:hypothetical protein